MILSLLAVLPFVFGGASVGTQWPISVAGSLSDRVCLQLPSRLLLLCALQVNASKDTRI